MKFQCAVKTLVLLLAVGCSRKADDPDPVQLPPDFGVVRHYYGAPIAPEYHFDYSITIDIAQPDTIMFHCDYLDGGDYDPPAWYESFDVSRESLDSLFRLMVNLNAMRSSWRQVEYPPEGSPSSAMWIRASTREFEIPTDVIDTGAVNPIYRMINTMVPQTIWDSLWSWRDQYIQNYPPSGPPR
ncbi:MAG: hypothetical protein JSU65_02970 [Candidatus Zixiibacteriota bacterium]|nr:MAG: hypothetical protein JSU65_02970 [candidate division Zixibacteria bacterium]